ncbi:MAG: glycosyltransferase [Spirochaetales bacterium]|nr:glycosyltransferase [Spirochaetales bacterium]
MHIGIFTDTYYPVINGVSTSTLSFSEELVKRGHHVSIFCPRYKGTKNEPKDPSKPGISVYRCFGFPLPTHQEHYITFPWLGFRVDIEALNLDIIHIQHPLLVSGYGVWISKKLGIPLTHTYHTHFEQYGHYIFLPRRIMRVLVKAVSKLICGLGSYTFVPSPQIKRILEGYGVTSRLVLCPTGIDIEGMKRTVNQELVDRHLDIDRKKRILLFASRICREKSVGYVVKAFPLIKKKIPDAILILSGDGPLVPEVTEMIKQMKMTDSIILKGYLSREDLYAYYKAADIFVFPSISETQGLVVLEAQAFGTPVVGVSQNGVQMIMEGNRGGLLASSRNHEEIAELCIALLSDRSLYEEKSREAADNAHSWRADKFVAVMEKHFREAIDEYKKKPGKPLLRRLHSV